MLHDSTVKSVGEDFYWCGLATGIILNVLLCPAYSSPACRDPGANACVDVTGQPVEVANLANVACEIQQSLFGSAAVPGIVFRLEGDITPPGKYNAFDAYDREATLVVSEVVSRDRKFLDPDLYAQGFVGRILWGTLSGPHGGLPVFGMEMLPRGISSDENFIFLAASVPSVQQIEEQSLDARLLSGARVPNVDSKSFMPLTSVVSAASMNVVGGDASPLIATGVNATAGGGR